MNGEYQVVLGAGASRAATNDYGTLPAGDSLSSDLIRDFHLPDPPPNTTLPQVYEMAARRFPDKISSYMSRKFTGATAPSWYRGFVSIPWRYIWTLNIDDVLEDAYNKTFSGVRRQKLTSRSWTDSHYVAQRPADEVIGLHLHGQAIKAEQNLGELIFDIRGYLHATASGHRWHKIFADEYRDWPVIVLGARLQGELDLYSALTAKMQDQDEAPSVLVIPDELNEWQLDDYSSKGLICVRATAEKFLEAVARDWNQYAKEYKKAEEIVGPLAFSFLQQWQRVNFGIVLKRGAFFEGHDPLPSDISAKLDGRREVTDDLMEILQDGRGQDSLAILCLFGAPFAGKTTTALRLLYDVNQKTGAEVFEYRGLAKIDVEAAAQWVRKSPGSILYLDGLADFREEISRLRQRCRELDVPLQVVATERESRMRTVRAAVRRDLQEKRIPVRITKGEANEILSIREANNRLGGLESKSWPERFQFIFGVHKGELFAALSGIEEYAGQGFIRRTVSRYESLSNDECRTLFLVTCVTSALGYQLPVGLALSASEMTNVTIYSLFERDHNLADILNYRQGRLTPHHRVFASHLLERLDRQSKWNATQALARTLAPHVSVSAIRQKTLPYRIAKELMDKDVLHDWLGSDQLDAWYESLEGEELFGWNARFWEQRALAQSELGHHSWALHYAYKACACNKDAYTLNTLATIKLRWAIDQVSLDYSESSSSYREAVKILDECRSRAREDSEYPYITFFSYTLRYARKLKSGNMTVEFRVKRDWDLWMGHARNSEAFSYPQGGNTLNQYHRDWLNLHVS
ncbi:hypothetical protein ACHGLA_30465 [Streptomyces sp. YH02]|uniref:P-loop NTPase n=1 Tax=Streptomyces sp. YH02 TaxID=3256999 RepID=UPI003757F24C